MRDDGASNDVIVEVDEEVVFLACVSRGVAFNIKNNNFLFWFYSTRNVFEKKIEHILINRHYC